MVLIDIPASSLDVSGGFTCIRLNTDDAAIANAQIGVILYLLQGGHYPQNIPLSSIA